MTGGDAVVGPAGAADLGRVAEIFAHYVTHSVATFETVPPTVADWQAKLDGLASLGLPFLASPRPAASGARYTVSSTVYR